MTAGCPPGGADDVREGSVGEHSAVVGRGHQEFTHCCYLPVISEWHWWQPNLFCFPALLFSISRGLWVCGASGRLILKAGSKRPGVQTLPIYLSFPPDFWLRTQKPSRQMILGPNGPFFYCDLRDQPCLLCLPLAHPPASAACFEDIHILIWCVPYQHIKCIWYGIAEHWWNNKSKSFEHCWEDADDYKWLRQNKEQDNLKAIKRMHYAIS